MNSKKIISLLPYTDPFLFVDSIDNVTETAIKGSYTYKKDEFFYKGHFKDNPVTPGVILIETIAQIGLVCFGIYLINDENFYHKNALIFLTSAEINFFKPVFPQEKVSVFSEKIYFRFGKLKCNSEMKNEKEELVCRGIISGMTKRVINE